MLICIKSNSAEVKLHDSLEKKKSRRNKREISDPSFPRTSVSYLSRRLLQLAQLLLSWDVLFASTRRK